MKFDPTVNSGQIVQIVTVVAVAFGAWANVKSDLAVQQVKIEQSKQQALQQSDDIKSIAADVRNVEKLVYEVKSELSRLQGRSSATPSQAAPAVPMR